MNAFHGSSEVLTQTPSVQGVWRPCMFQPPVALVNRTGAPAEDVYYARQVSFSLGGGGGLMGIHCDVTWFVLAVCARVAGQSPARLRRLSCGRLSSRLTPGANARRSPTQLPHHARFGTTRLSEHTDLGLLKCGCTGRFVKPLARVCRAMPPFWRSLPDASSSLH